MSGNLYTLRDETDNGPVLGCCDGLLRSDDGDLESKIFGGVIGLYASQFEEPDAGHPRTES